MNRTTFTLAEAARLLNCHPETLRRAIRDGSLRAARLGRGYRLSRSDLQAFWTEQGGGSLFDPAEDAGETPQGARSDTGRGPSDSSGLARKTDHDPRQLSLIASPGREP